MSMIVIHAMMMMMMMMIEFFPPKVVFHTFTKACSFSQETTEWRKKRTVNPSNAEANFAQSTRMQRF